MLKPIEWTQDSVRLLDQTKLPDQTVYIEITDEKQMWDAIRRLVVRGAPAIGIAAAFGAYLGVRNVIRDVQKRLDEVCEYLATSRPTAVNLFWAIKRVRAVAHSVKDHEVPARILGISARKGKLEGGYDGDVVVLTEKFEIERVFARGVEVNA